MKAIADTLDVARSNLIEQTSSPRQPRTRSPKAEDDGLLVLIRPIVDARPSYGYRGITALLNRELVAAGKPQVDGKRVLRILALNGLTLERHTAHRPGRTYEGVVIAVKSNVRWCSDHLDLHCREGAIVRVLFAIDACDREIMGLVGGCRCGRLGRDGARHDDRLR